MPWTICPVPLGSGTPVFFDLRVTSPGPMLRLITLAPWSAAHSMPYSTSEVQPDPLLSSTLTMSAWASGATAAMPCPLSVSATMIPVVIDPCPLSSATAAGPVPVGWSLSGAVPPRKDAPATSLPLRSGWLKLAPVSTSATRTFAPVLAHQAAGALMLAVVPVSAHWSSSVTKK
jgi:hypothetical protein